MPAIYRYCAWCGGKFDDEATRAFVHDSCLKKHRH